MKNLFPLNIIKHLFLEDMYVYEGQDYKSIISEKDKTAFDELVAGKHIYSHNWIDECKYNPKQYGHKTKADFWLYKVRYICIEIKLADWLLGRVNSLY